MASEEKTKSRRSAQRAAAQSQPRQSVPVAQAKEPALESAWHERAAFQIAFDHSVDADGQPIWQTRAYHEEADGRTIWPGIAGEALMIWMRERADLPTESHAPSPPAAPAKQPPPADRPVEAPADDDHGPLQITIDQLSVEASLAEQQVGGASIKPQLDARISFHLSGVPAYLATTSESSYLIQIVAHDLVQNHVAILALEGQQLQPELIEYSAALSFEPPQVGEYQIIALVLLPEQTIAATELGPVLTVNPPGGGGSL
jgi:hypothetical protein